jgi:hypothetical protein
LYLFTFYCRCFGKTELVRGGEKRKRKRKKKEKNKKKEKEKKQKGRKKEKEKTRKREEEQIMYRTSEDAREERESGH